MLASALASYHLIIRHFNRDHLTAFPFSASLLFWEIFGAPVHSNAVGRGVIHERDYPTVRTDIELPGIQLACVADASTNKVSLV